MKLSEEQKRQMLKRLDEAWGAERICPVCRHDEWAVFDTVFEVREFVGGGINVGGGTVIPCIVVTCKHCSNTLFFNAIKLGLVPPPEKEKKGEKEAA
jgi:hypothetical protein